jgi:hypothetical protein
MDRAVDLLAGSRFTVISSSGHNYHACCRQLSDSTAKRVVSP